MNVQKKLRGLLALEFNCSPAAFDRDEAVLTEPALLEGRRQYSKEPYFFHMVTLGRNAVITADERLHPFLQDFMKDKQGHWLFEYPNLKQLDKELQKHGRTVTQSYHMFLPLKTAPAPKADFSVRWYTQAELKQFYGDKRFSNVLCTAFLPERPDMLAVCAMDGDQIMGVAGCSADAPRWWQIGIDVLPQYRGRGVGTYLVNLLRRRIETEGKIPFYGTSLSNLHSWNIALACGFRPAWVEIGERPYEA